MSTHSPRRIGRGLIRKAPPRFTRFCLEANERHPLHGLASASEAPAGDRPSSVTNKDKGNELGSGAIPQVFERTAAPRARPYCAHDVSAPNVVDLGCGAGNVTAFLAGRWPERASSASTTRPRCWRRRARRRQGSRAATGSTRTSRPTPRGSDRRRLQQRRTALAGRSRDSSRGSSIGSRPAECSRCRCRINSRRRRTSQLRRSSHSAVARSARCGAAADAGVTTADYFRLLSGHARAVDAWTTEYLHVLPPSRDGVHPVVAWIMGTTLTPYLAVLPDDLQRAFIDDVSQRVAAAYPMLPDGRVLFPFRRVFIVASRATR